jgi:integrase
LRDYVLPIISEIPIADITSTQIRGLLLKISEPGFIEKKNDKTFTISPGTRTRVKALLSVMFSDALNEDPPLVRFNPVLGLKIKDKRRGNKKPRVLGDKDTCIDFIANAKKISPLHFTIVCLDLMSGLRKQELIALKWRSVDFKNRILIITEKYEQASGEIKAGTKGGENTSRVIPIPMLLVDILKAHKKDSDHTGPDSFVFSNPNGTFLGPKKIWEIVHDVAVASKIDISTHGLRHTFGREFALNTGNLKALQAILGHSSSQTTDIYSDLANSRIRGFGESVTFDIGVKSSDE